MYFLCDLYIPNSQWTELPHSAHRVYLCTCILPGYQNKQQILSNFALLIYTTQKECKISPHLLTVVHFTVLLHSQCNARQSVNKELV